jgi:archaellum component FlaG (FlaF/FlaG flagellin family)
MHEPGPNREVLARLTDKCSPGQLEVEIKVGDKADLGEHRLSVTTPAGKAEAPDDKVFEVRGPVEAAQDE